MLDTLLSEWIRYAEEDADSAKQLLQTTANYDVICFLSHSATEKIMKSFLISKDCKAPRIHDLVELLNRVTAFITEPAEMRLKLNNLTQYLPKARYPFGDSLNKSDAVLCVSIMEECFHWLREEIN